MKTQHSTKQTLFSMALLTAILLFSIFNIPIVNSQVKNPGEIVVANLWGPTTVDPAWTYDTASSELIMNVYDTLIWFGTNWTARDYNPEWAGRVDSFAACLADDWVVPGGFNAPGGDGRWNTTEFPAVHPTAPGYTDATYYFHIRSNVQFHDSTTYGNVTPEDVEYSVERWMALDRSGGPAWMIYEPLLDTHGANWSDPTMAGKILNAVERNDTSGWIWFNLAATEYSALFFLQVIAQSWASVIDKQWAADHNCWPGETYTNDNMSAYYDPPVSPLDDWPPGTGGKVEMGSGPYTLDTFDSLGQWYRLEYFPGYWQGWPAPNCDDYIRTVTMRGIEEWGTRKSMFLAGDADFCYVSRAHIPELILNWTQGSTWETEDYPTGIDCLPGLPTLSLSAFFPNREISTASNPYMGLIQSPSTFSEMGIPPNFFNDTNVRKAFAYCFNWQNYITAAYVGEAEQPATPHIKGLAYNEFVRDVMEDDLSPSDTLIAPDTLWKQPTLPNGSGPLAPVPMYYQNLTKAEAQFKLAWDGEMWNSGFTFSIAFKAGDDEVYKASKMLKQAVESLNPKFHVNIVGLSQPLLMSEVRSRRLPMFIMDIQGYHSDPHSFYHLFMYNRGLLAYYQSLAYPSIDRYIPSSYVLLGDTSLFSGSICDLAANDASRMTFQSYGPTGNYSVQYAHAENESVAGVTTYYKLKVESPSSNGTNLSANSTEPVRRLLGNFVYPLTGVSSIPAGNWKIHCFANKTHSQISAHFNFDIMVRQANGVPRQVIAANVADTTGVTNSWTTVSGNYFFPGYSVVNQSDYLEVDFYARITSTWPGGHVYLRIDDNSLPTVKQTRIESTIPATYTAEVEFTEQMRVRWNPLTWSVDSSWSDRVEVTVQLFNYSLGRYATSGAAHVSYVAAPNTYMTVGGNIEKVQDFHDAAGNWKMKIKGSKDYDPYAYTPFDFTAEQVKFEGKVNAAYGESIQRKIKAAAGESDENARVILYWELGNEYHYDVTSIPIAHWTGRHWERGWIKGWYYNPLYPGNFYYHLWKAEPMAWEQIDLSAEATITPTTTPPILQVHEHEYRLSGSTYEQNFSIHVERVDANTNVAFVFAIIDLRRHDPADVGDFIIAEDDQTSEIFTLTAGDEFTYNCTYGETTTAEVGSWNVSGYVTAISGSAYDNVTANNNAPDGSFVAAELVGDIDGSGEVDIFDAILLAGSLGSAVGEPRRNDFCDLNGDGIIDIFDAILLAGSFGDSIP